MEARTHAIALSGMIHAVFCVKTLNGRFVEEGEEGGGGHGQSTDGFTGRGCAVNVWNVFERRGQVNNTTINCGGQYYKTIHTMLQHLVRSSIRVGRYYINGMVTFAQMYIHGHTTINYFWRGIISMGAGRDQCLTFHFCCVLECEKLQITNYRAARGEIYHVIQQPAR